jgi:hypothetical protein
MAFDDIPEDKEPSFPCACGGNIKKRNGKWECDSCDWKQGSDDCDQVSDLIDAPIMISAWSSGDANYSIRSGVDVLKCTALDSSQMTVHLKPSDNAEELSAAPTNDEHGKITQKNENRRVGRFEISRKLIEDGAVKHWPEGQ